MTSKHITRDYSAHKKDIKRPYDEFVSVEIFSYIPKYTKTYHVQNGKLKKGTNCVKTSWKSWKCYRTDIGTDTESEDKRSDEVMTFNVKYNARIKGWYRIDILYEQSNHIFGNSKDTSRDLIGSFAVYYDNAEQSSQNVKFDGENNITKRKTFYKELKKGTNYFEIEVPRNCYFYGVIVRKLKKFKGTNYYGYDTDKDNGILSLRSATVTISDMVKPSELQFEIAYDDALECDDSPSGFYIDFRDEVNFYVKDNDKKIRRVFGGYVSSILPDSDRTRLTIHCADRLSDGTNKYILDELVMNGGTSKDKDSYRKSMTKNFTKYSQALKYLCNIHETTLKSNISKNYLVSGEKYNKGFTITYGKSKKVRNLGVKNGHFTMNKNYVVLRNNPESSKKQVWTLYQAKKHGHKAPALYEVGKSETKNYGHMHITYGLGSPKTEHESKITKTVSTVETTAGVKKFTKCGVSSDKKYVMGIGTNSAGKQTGTYPEMVMFKSVFENKCPHCGKASLRWDSGRADTKCIYSAGNNGTKRWFGIPETEITCNSCDSDYDAVTGWEKDENHSTKLKKVGQTVKSSKKEQDKLHKGEMEEVPATNEEITPDEIFTAITNEAFKYRYKLRGDTCSSYSCMKKAGHGDCWAFSDLIITMFRKYNITSRVVQYDTGFNHRSVQYKDANGKWANFPYREKGWDTRYNNNLNDTNGVWTGRVVDSHKGTNIGNVKTKTKKTTKKETIKITTTKGYDKDKPFQGYLKVVYSNSSSFNAKKKTIYIKFTQDITENGAINTGFPLYWVNNTTRKSELKMDIVDFIHSKDHNNANIYLQSIYMITPKIQAKTKKEDKDWYKYTKENRDESSCKLRLYQIGFNSKGSAEPSELNSCGKSINNMLQELVKETGYLVDMSYAEYRRDDKINFRVANQSTPVFTATEGDENNILSWNSISYSPISSLFNMSMQVFKKSDGYYYYTDSRVPSSILEYGEQCTLETSSNPISSSEAYFNARNNEKYNPEQTYSYTITVPNYPHLRLGDLVQVIANAKKLSTIKELKSIKITFDVSKMPRIRTELGLGELAPDIQLKKNIRTLRRNAKEKTTHFDGSATAINEPEIYEWE